MASNLELHLRAANPASFGSLPLRVNYHHWVHCHQRAHYHQRVSTTTKGFPIADVSRTIKLLRPYLTIDEVSRTIMLLLPYLHKVTAPIPPNRWGFTHHKVTTPIPHLPKCAQSRASIYGVFQKESLDSISWLVSFKTNFTTGFITTTEFIRS